MNIAGYCCSHKLKRERAGDGGAMGEGKNVKGSEPAIVRQAVGEWETPLPSQFGARFNLPACAIASPENLEVEGTATSWASCCLHRGLNMSTTAWKGFWHRLYSRVGLKFPKRHPALHESEGLDFENAKIKAKGQNILQHSECGSLGAYFAMPCSSRDGHGRVEPT